MPKRTMTRLLAAFLALVVVGGVAARDSSSKHNSGDTTVSYWAASMAPTVTADRTILTRELATFTAQLLCGWMPLPRSARCQELSGDG
jgi:hypothetical protein